MKDSLQQVQCVPSPFSDLHCCGLIARLYCYSPDSAAASKDPEGASDMQAFAAKDPETATDEDESMPEAQHGAPACASEAERRAVLERLQGQDSHLAAGFKVCCHRTPTSELHQDRVVASCLPPPAACR